MPDWTQIERQADDALPSAVTRNPRGHSPFLLVCDHASNRIPARYGDLGLGLAERLRHIAWDPGALAVSFALGEHLDATLVYANVSRLVVDTNRAADAPDAIVTVSESTEIPGNTRLGPAERQERLVHHAAFHQTVSAQIAARRQRGQETVLVGIHSFTPVYRGVARPWPIGLIHGRDERLTRHLFNALRRADPALDVGWNLPYAGLVGVTHTLERHGDDEGLHSTMVEIRNDQILDPAGIALWAGRLARCLEEARYRLRTANPDGPNAA